MKRIELANIKIDTDMDADDYGQRIVECVQHLNPDVNVVNLVKVDLGDSHIPIYELSRFLQNLKEMFVSVNASNCVLVPIGEQCGIKDIKIDYLKVVE